VEAMLLYLALILLLVSTLVALGLLWRSSPMVQMAVWGILGGVLLLLVAMLVLRGINGNQLPVNSLYEFTLLMTAGLLTLGLVILRQQKNPPILLLLLSLLSLLLLSIASTLPQVIRPPVPALQSPWLLLHVVTATVAYGAFGVAFCLALIYLYRGKEVPAVEQNRLAGIDRLIYRLVSWGFLFMSLVLITGAVWAEEVWGSWWSWDPKETFALVTWLAYAFYLHGRRTKEWKGRRAAWVVVIGFLVVIFTLFGVTFLLPGVHSYV